MGKTLKTLYGTICRTNKDHGSQLYNTASPGGLKKLETIHREGIRIYTGACRTSPVEANDQPIGLRLLYKLKSNTSYIRTLKTLDDSEDQIYVEKERSIKPTGVYIKKLKRRFMEEQNEIEKINQTQQPP